MKMNRKIWEMTANEDGGGISDGNEEMVRSIFLTELDLAAIGFGVAGVTEEFVRKELDSGRLKKLKTSFEIPARSVDMCLLSDVPQSAAAERFTDFVKDSLSKQ